MERSNFLARDCKRKLGVCIESTDPVWITNEPVVVIVIIHSVDYEKPLTKGADAHPQVLPQLAFAGWSQLAAACCRWVDDDGSVGRLTFRW
jgi:hypothetical protein